MGTRSFSHTQVPAWYRFRVGQFECTVVSDGNIDTTGAGPLFPHTDPAEVEKAKLAVCPPNHSSHWLAQNVLVVNTGERIVLVDCGMGRLDPTFQPHAGKLLENMGQAGLHPDDVDFILLTHLHADHSGGLVTPDGSRTFPNARLVIDPADMPTGPPSSQPPQGDMERVAYLAHKSVQAYLDDFVPAHQLSELIDGFTTIPTPGHTPGHCSYQVESNGDSLLVVGDLAHDYAIEPLRPEWENVYDADPSTALETRLRAYRRYSADRQKIFAYHFPFPGLGWFAEDGPGYRYLPEPLNLLADAVSPES